MTECQTFWLYPKEIEKDNKLKIPVRVKYKLGKTHSIHIVKLFCLFLSRNKLRSWYAKIQVNYEGSWSPSLCAVSAKTTLSKG